MASLRKNLLNGLNAFYVCGPRAGQTVARETVYRFFPFQLDSRGGSLWKGLEPRPLRAKTFALLQYLVAHPGELVLKEELFETLWSGLAVSEAVLTVCVSELRKALDDDPQDPRFIETVPRRGYRFVAPVEAANAEPAPVSSRSPSLFAEQPLYVGREAELARLHRAWNLALAGARQTVFVSGEAGIGKSTLVDALINVVQRSATALIGCGRCVGHDGGGEAYLPILQALRRMCQGETGRDARDVLLRHAPSWIAQMPGLIEEVAPESIKLRAGSATQTRMLRELGEALELLSELRPLLLVCEDLHSGDRPTLELIAGLARRSEAARLLFLGTYGASELSPPDHRLSEVVNGLQAHNRCAQIRLKGLREAAVAEYLRRRGASVAIPAELAHQVYRRTGGNPLFMSAIAEQLLAEDRSNNGVGPRNLADSRIPESVRQLIEQQFARVNADQRRMLEAASVAGAEFSTASVSAALGIDRKARTEEQIEQACEELMRTTPFLGTRGLMQWPDGTIGAVYAFRHELYREVLYYLTDPVDRQRAHRRIGQRLEAAYGGDAGEVAYELAMHFERGGEPRRAAKYLELCAEAAFNRSANQEAVAYADRGLGLVRQTAPDDERWQAELWLELMRATALMSLSGFAAPEVAQSYARARQLISQAAESPALMLALLGLAKYYLVRMELRTSFAMAERCLHLAENTGDVSLLVASHVTVGAILFNRALYRTSLAHMEQTAALYDPIKHRSHALLYGLDSAVAAKAYSALCLWRLGYPDQAKRRSLEAVAAAQQLSHAHTTAHAIAAAAAIRVACCDTMAAHVWAGRLLELSADKEVPLWHAWGLIFRGEACLQQGQAAEAVRSIREGIAEMAATGADTAPVKVRSVLGEIASREMTPERGIDLVSATLAQSERTGGFPDQSELYRFMGLLKLRSQRRHPQHHVLVEAEAWMVRAVEDARRRDAKSLELRATNDLCRLWKRQGKKPEALETLERIYGWFNEGFDTGDLKDAKTLIESLR
jgi:predicted ATPase/DNA-binding winged helix-turn-helix (wHTH) protein